MNRLAAGLLVTLLVSPSLTAQDAKKIPLTGAASAELAGFDEMMLKFVADHQVPGAAVAVAKDGRLVYARGFGYADSQAGIVLEPRMRFRIASISKPITAAAILRLIELGLLKMEDNPFAVLDIILPAGADPRLRKITIRQLLEHTAGWDRVVSFDPMFRPILIAKDQNAKAPAEPMAIIHYMTKQKLDFDPGARYAYSNFGYCLLGRVIEKKSGLAYDAFVQKHLFDPIGIKDTQIGKTLKAAANEVKYHDDKQGPAVLGPEVGKPAPRPYGAWYLEAMDSHGGWISTAPDLVRFASAFNRPAQSPLLKEDSIKKMLTRPEGLPKKDVYYALGWQVRTLGSAAKVNTWHTGSLDGTSTILVRRHDGLCWAVLFNARTNAKGQILSGLVDPLLHDAADKVKNWPKK